MSGKERKRDKVKKKIKKLYERLKKSTDLPKEVRLQVQTALQDVSGPSLYIGGDLPVAKPNRENTVFQRITAIVLEVGDQNPSFQGFSTHPWDPKKPKKGTLADTAEDIQIIQDRMLAARMKRGASSNSGASSVSAITVSAPISLTISMSSIALPLPKKVAGSG
jgi:hypothetical protein